ncbi:hypothetical protein SAMN05444422_11347 [Halobiforma haloterrestris]|uniref:Uncharacterized protein n=1 Tax=Natronobacterium haloterrestre TaxID=148448 RepID=A0A1I1KX08_NATHA|nr:hypothetical protein [Halobiforma haloterrestris]SFC65347.1 hypothetical protein SAMN05444422_11347 [Halobiforma haloterrestris]
MNSDGHRVKVLAYHCVRWAWRIYNAAVIVSLLYLGYVIAEAAGYVPDGYVRTIWASLAVLTVLFGLILLPLASTEQ